MALTEGNLKNSNGRGSSESLTVDCCMKVGKKRDLLEDSSFLLFSTIFSFRGFISFCLYFILVYFSFLFVPENYSVKYCSFFYFSSLFLLDVIKYLIFQLIRGSCKYCETIIKCTDECFFYTFSRDLSMVLFYHSFPPNDVIYHFYISKIFHKHPQFSHK